MWRLYVAVNHVSFYGTGTVIIYNDSVCTSQRTPYASIGKKLYPLLFVTEAYGVLCEVRTESLHTRKRCQGKDVFRDFTNAPRSVTTVD
jgi:hypothetical protein